MTPRHSFIRFVRPKLILGTSAREGFFCAAYALRNDPHCDNITHQRVSDLLSWFSAHLAIPENFSRTSSKGFRNRVFTPGLSWFRDDATIMLDKAFDLTALLTDHGHHVEMLRTSRVGYILYEDAYQVVAEPFGDTPV